jgi:PAS domain S-box-containing protein
MEAIHDPRTLEEAEALLEQLAQAFVQAQTDGHSAKRREAVPALGGSPPTSDAPAAFDRLKHSEVRYRTLVEQIPAITFMASLQEGLDENEIYVSPHIETMLGFTQKEWLGDPFLWHRQLHPDDRQRWGEEFARTCASGVNFSSEYRFISRDNREVWVHGEARVVRDEQGHPLFLQGIAFDITESKRAEQTLRRSAEELEQKVRERTIALEEATQRAEAASQARASFLANMSHEIRTPLNGIIGFADLLRRGAASDEAEQKQWLEIIVDSGGHLLSLINDALDLSKVDAGKLTVEVLACSPIKIINEVCSILRSKAEEKGLELSAQFERAIPLMIRSDPTRFRQIIINIVGNAIKFTASGGIRINCSLRQPADDEPKLIIQITDTGIGIPQDKLDMIFERFTQADSSITRQFGGTGLGLAISQQLAHLLGGGITVESEPGRGTTFTCEIATGPLEDVEWLESPDALPGAVPATELVDTSALKDRRVLVVDDSETNRKLMRLMLRGAGAHVEQAENGGQALQRALAESFDVILMDMQMPVMDGYTATRELRRSGLTGPIIALTANAMKEDSARCLAAGCSAYLAKPIDQDLLLATVCAAVRGSKATSTNLDVPPPAEPAPDEPASASQSTAIPAEERLVSRLLTSDAEFREIVEQFVVRLREQIAAMRIAVVGGDLRELARLAHWLKGTGGTAGFPELTERARELEQFARELKIDDARHAVRQLEQMAGRIVIE